VRARPAAVMATRWSRLHGEFYLRRGRGFGEVEDVEELMVVLWFGGIRQWHSVSGDLARRRHGVPGHRARVEGDGREEMAR